MARQLGIDIEDLVNDTKERNTGVGRQYEDFILEKDKKTIQKACQHT